MRDNCDTDAWLAAQRSEWNTAARKCCACIIALWQHVTFNWKTQAGEGKWALCSLFQPSKKNYSASSACFSFSLPQSLIFSQRCIYTPRSGSLLLYCGESLAALGSLWRLHRRQQGAPSDLLEGDLNSVLFNVFFLGGRQAGGYTGPIIFP